LSMRRRLKDEAKRRSNEQSPKYSKFKNKSNESRQAYLKIEPTSSKASRSNKVGVQ